MKFRSYPKIHRLGKEETDDILLDPVTIQEKIDGANVSMWFDGKKVKCGTRTRELPDDESFNGFVEAVKANKKLAKWLKNNPTVRLYGEWLVKHTITYPDTAYKKIYLYDVIDETKNEEDRVYWSQPDVEKLATELDLEYPQIFITDKMVTISEINEFVGKTLVPDAANGEGVVIKNPKFRDKWGNHCYAKVVHEKFKESNAIIFGGNNKHSDSYWEMYVVNKYCTLGRVQKIMQKLQAETDRRLDKIHTKEISGRCMHDMITEEAWEIFNKVPVIDNKKLKHLAGRKFVQLFHDTLDNTLSIADTEKK